jgi:hypothetical protein
VFLRGFLFALGFGVGCLVLCFTLVTAIAVIEKSILRFCQPNEMDGAVDIRRWKERKFVRKSGHNSPRSAG